MGRTTIAFLNVLIFLLALTARVLPGPRTIDNSYITFRYARNLLAGEGFVYNPGERVMGTTTPLYTIVMAGLGAVSGRTQAPFPLLALGVNALADAITCVLLFWLGRRLGVPFAGLGAALVWSVAPYSVTFAVGGLETSVYVLLLTGMFCAHLARRHRLAALLAALALLTRPDALILIGLVALDRAWQLLREAREARSWQDRAGIQDRESYANLIGDILRQAAPELAIFLIPTLLWLGFATVYFGTPIPHSVAAKSLAYRLTREAGLVRLLQHYGTPFMENLTLGSRFPLYGFFLYLFLFLLGARRIVKTDAHAWPWLAYPWAYFVLFAFANPLIFRWYLTPPLPALMLAVLGGVEGIVRDIFRLDGRVLAPGAGRAALAGFCALVLVVISPAWLILHGWTLHPDHGIATPAPQMAWYQLELLYSQAARRVLQDVVLEDIVLKDAGKDLRKSAWLRATWACSAIPAGCTSWTPWGSTRLNRPATIRSTPSTIRSATPSRRSWCWTSSRITWWCWKFTSATGC